MRTARLLERSYIGWPANWVGMGMMPVFVWTMSHHQGGMMKAILLRTTTNDEFGEDDGYEYGLVKLSEQSAKTLAGFLNQFRANKQNHDSLIEMTFEDTHAPCYFYPSEAFCDRDGEVIGLSDDQRDEFVDQGWSVLPDNYELPDPTMCHSPEAVYLVVNKHGFHWLALPKDKSYHVETEAPDTDIIGQLI